MQERDQTFKKLEAYCIIFLWFCCQGHWFIWVCQGRLLKSVVWLREKWII